jgi:hypothetical protein
MTFHIFVCSKDGTLYGITEEPKGAKLPSGACSDGKWKPFRQIEDARANLTAAEVQQVKEQGYCLRRGTVTTTETVVSAKTKT